jgi:hypothetical protein
MLWYYGGSNALLLLVLWYHPLKLTAGAAWCSEYSVTLVLWCCGTPVSSCSGSGLSARLVTLGSSGTLVLLLTTSLL